MQELKVSAKKVNWFSVIVFYFLACAISWPFFWWRDMHPESWKSLEIPHFLKTWSFMWGPGLSALLCFFIFRRSHIRHVSFFGSSFKKSLLFYFVPLLALCIPGIRSKDVNTHLAPLLFGTLGFVSILGEELGWRGFLQDALKPLPDLKKYILIGVMWELWHFTNRMGHGELLQIIIRVSVAMCFVIFFSFLIGKATDKSLSLTVAVTLHAWIDILFELNELWGYVIFGLALPFWIYMLYTWNKKPVPQPIINNTIDIENK